MNSPFRPALLLFVVLLSPGLWAESSEAGAPDPDASLSQRVAELEAELAQDRREDALRRGSAPPVTEVTDAPRDTLQPVSGLDRGI